MFYDVHIIAYDTQKFVRLYNTLLFESAYFNVGLGSKEIIWEYACIDNHMGYAVFEKLKISRIYRNFITLFTFI